MGAVQQFKEEGHLVYQDWWVRDVRKEELDASPDTRITSFLDEDGNLTQSIFFEDQNSSTEKRMSPRRIRTLSGTRGRGAI